MTACGAGAARVDRSINFTPSQLKAWSWYKPLAHCRYDIHMFKSISSHKLVELQPSQVKLHYCLRVDLQSTWSHKRFKWRHIDWPSRLPRLATIDRHEQYICKLYNTNHMVDFSCWPCSCGVPSTGVYVNNSFSCFCRFPRISTIICHITCMTLTAIAVEIAIISMPLLPPKPCNCRCNYHFHHGTYCYIIILNKSI
jgi:hypothetical protein